jgi:hypothetical protein
MFNAEKLKTVPSKLVCYKLIVSFVTKRQQAESSIVDSVTLADVKCLLEIIIYSSNYFLV